MTVSGSLAASLRNSVGRAWRAGNDNNTANC